MADNYNNNNNEKEVVNSSVIEVNDGVKNETISKLNFKRIGKNKTCGQICLRVFFTTLCLLTSLQSLGTIAVTVSSAIASKVYSSEQSGRLVAMVVLATTAAAALVMVIYAAIAVIKGHRKSLHTTATVLVILSVIQVIIVAVAVKVTMEDEINLSRSLSESFRLAKEHSPRHVKLWATTQFDLECCGVYSAEDYRSPNSPVHFPPDVPISCCPKYDQDRSELVQEREREFCRAKKEYYDVGCKNLVVEVFKETENLVMGMTIALIILEVLLSVTGGFCKALQRKRGLETGEENKNQS